MTPDTLTFVSEGTDLRGLALRRASTTASRPRPGRPVVVMAHGLAGTKDSGLAPFAEALRRRRARRARLRLPRLRRQRRRSRARSCRWRGQVEDYRAAIDAAARLPGVDPQPAGALGRLAGRRARARGRRATATDVAAVVALTPLVDGLAAGRHALRHHTPGQLLRSTGTGIREPGLVGRRRRPGDDAGRRAAGRARRLHPARRARGLPGDRRARPGATRSTRASGWSSARPGPGKSAREVRCPVLVQIADFDRSAPPQAAAKAAFKPPAPRYVTTPATTSTSGRARPGTSPRWRTPSTSSSASSRRRPHPPTDLPH